MLNQLLKVYSFGTGSQALTPFVNASSTTDCCSSCHIEWYTRYFRSIKSRTFVW